MVTSRVTALRVVVRLPLPAEEASEVEEEVQILPIPESTYSQIQIPPRMNRQSSHLVVEIVDVVVEIVDVVVEIVDVVVVVIIIVDAPQDVVQERKRIVQIPEYKMQNVFGSNRRLKTHIFNHHLVKKNLLQHQTWDERKFFKNFKH